MSRTAFKSPSAESHLALFHYFSLSLSFLVDFHKRFVFSRVVCVNDTLPLLLCSRPARSLSSDAAPCSSSTSPSVLNLTFTPFLSPSFSPSPNPSHASVHPVFHDPDSFILSVLSCRCRSSRQRCVQLSTRIWRRLCLATKKPSSNACRSSVSTSR